MFATSLPVKIKINLIVDPVIPGEEIHGFSEEDSVVCKVTFTPEFKFIMGTATSQESVKEWRANKVCSDHILARAEWAMMGHMTMGSA